MSEEIDAVAALIHAEHELREATRALDRAMGLSFTLMPLNVPDKDLNAWRVEQTRAESDAVQKATAKRDRCLEASPWTAEEWQEKVNAAFAKSKNESAPL